MATVLDEKTLQDAAQNGEMDYDKWPAIIEPLLQRLNEIVYTEFPMPRPYAALSKPMQGSPSQAREANAAAPTPSTPLRHLPPVPPFPSSSATPSSRVTDSLPPSQDAAADNPNGLPTLLLHILNNVTQTLRAAFSDKPPHTIQRLAELVLSPTEHYKTLPAWLRAVDRTVCVSSAADIFPLTDAPLPTNHVNGEGGGILWSNSDARNGHDGSALGSDESLGGALLTPIPWLRNGLAGGDEGGEVHLDSTGSVDAGGMSDSIPLPPQADVNPLVPERADGAVTQGELIRLEQEAGVVPVTQHPHDTNLSSAPAATEDGLFMDDGAIVPHARGPDLVGSVDMGRVGGHDVQIRLGSPPGDAPALDLEASDAQSVLSGGERPSTETDEQGTSRSSDSDDFEIVLKDAEQPTDPMQVDEIERGDHPPSTEDGDDDIVLVDTDGKSDGEPKTDATGVDVALDAVESSTAQ